MRQSDSSSRLSVCAKASASPSSLSAAAESSGSMTAQGRVVVNIFVAQGQGEHALADQGLHCTECSMCDLPRFSRPAGTDTRRSKNRAKRPMFTLKKNLLTTHL